MAKNIDFMGAVFPDVPSVKLPQQGGGLVAFDDTTDATATADKILQGYTAYAGGEKLVGTASGGITPSGTISITQNGQVDVTQYAIADVNVSGGGGAASNFVTGTFVVGSTAYEKETVTVPYSGSGYPIALVIYVEGGCNNYNDTTPWHDSTLMYSVGQTIITKGDTTTAPTYGSGIENQATVQHLYKSSSSSASSYSSTRSNAAYLYKTGNPSGTTSCVVWSSNTTFKYNVSGGSANAYGLLPNTTYRYYAVYSS